MPLPNITRFCGAKTDNGPCPQPAMENGRCYKHGGATPSGIASPHFVHGRRAKSLPTRLVERYHEHLSDPNLVSLDSELAETDLRLGELFDKLDAGGSRELWRALGEQYAVAAGLRRRANDNKLEEKYRKEAERDFFAAFDQMAFLIQAIGQDEAVWNEVREWHEHRRSLASTERERIVAAVKTGKLYPAEKVLALAAACLALVRENVSDRRALAAIQSGIDSLVAQDGVGA